MKYIISALAAFMCGGSAAVKLIPIAAAERGYSGAIGGEWALIIVASIIGAVAGAKICEIIDNIN